MDKLFSEYRIFKTLGDETSPKPFLATAPPARDRGHFCLIDRSFFCIMTKKSKTIFCLSICRILMEESARKKRMIAYDPISWLRVKEGKCWFGHYYWMNRKIPSLKQRQNMRLSDRIEVMPFQFLSSFKYSYHGFSRWCSLVYVLCSNF